MEFVFDNEVKAAMYDVARLVSSSDREAQELAQMLKKVVTVNYVNGAIAGTSHAGGTTPSIDFKMVNNKIMRSVNGITVTLPNNPTNVNHCRVDYRHEIFHAIANLFNNKEAKLDGKTNTLIANAGGKIEVRDINHVKTNFHESPASVLFNEIVTDISAYCSYYPKAGISVNSILNGEGLKEIKEKYGMGNGYRPLLPMGLCIIKAFSNQQCNYDNLGSNMYGSKYQTADGKDVYINDLFQGVLFDPMWLKEKFTEYTSPEEWEKLDQVADRIMKTYKSNLSVRYEDTKYCLDIMAKYLIQKCERATDPTVRENLAKIIREYNELYIRTVDYYKSMDSDRNER